VFVPGNEPEQGLALVSHEWLWEYGQNGMLQKSMRIIQGVIEIQSHLAFCILFII
jgi:hypothetical protein